jgi:LCP family protein required for cell wall assembly
VVVGLVIVVLIVAVGGDYLLLNGRIAHVDISFPLRGTGTTYVIVGSDSRAALPPGASRAAFGSASAVPGQRADLVVVVHVVGAHTWVLSVPRDTLVSPATGTVERLTLALLGGPQDVVDGLCRTLNIPADHLVIVNFRSFAGIVDQVGGITVTLPHPVRDPVSGLDLPKAGVVHLDGLQALALVRSRNPQWLIHGTWTMVPDGSVQRTDWAGRVFTAVLRSAHTLGDDPITLQELAWSASGSLTTDQGTDLSSLLTLSKVTGSVQSLSGTSLANSLAVVPNASTFAALARAGYSRRCTTG